jgi:hypothetical protein
MPAVPVHDTREVRASLQFPALLKTGQPHSVFRPDGAKVIAEEVHKALLTVHLPM